jgi:hypothetical protein
MILLRHRAEVPTELHSSNGLTPIVRRTPDVLAYDPRTGHRLGSLGTKNIADHRDSLVLLDTRRVPTAEELQAIRVTDDGKVVMP